MYALLSIVMMIHIYISSECLSYSVLPTLSPHIPTNFSITAPPSTPFLCLNMPCPFVFLHLAPAHLTIHLNLIIHFLFSLTIIYNHGPIFCMILLPRLLHSLGVIPCPLFPISKASFTSSTISPKHFKSLMPPAFATFFFNFVYHNITTCNAMLSSLQMSSYLLIEPFLSVFGVPLKNITVRQLWLLNFAHLCADVSHFSPPQTTITNHNLSQAHCLT